MRMPTGRRRGRWRERPVKERISSLLKSWWGSWQSTFKLTLKLNNQCRYPVMFFIPMQSMVVRLLCMFSNFPQLISSKVPKAEYVPNIIRRDDPSIIPILYVSSHRTLCAIFIYVVLHWNKTNSKIVRWMKNEDILTSLLLSTIPAMAVPEKMLNQNCLSSPSGHFTSACQDKLCNDILTFISLNCTFSTPVEADENMIGFRGILSWTADKWKFWSVGGTRWSQGITNIRRIHPLRAMNVFTKSI